MYYLWIDEAQAGPFTMHQLQEMWNAGHITALTPYWQEGKPDWQLLHTILPELEPGSTQPPPEISETVYIPQFEQKILKKVGTPAYHPEAVPAAPAAAIPTDTAAAGEQVLWTGHPTLWKWFPHLLFGVILVGALEGAAIYWQVLIGMIMAPILVALITLTPIFLVRNSIRYGVSNRRVSLEMGIFTRNSRELRLHDIRSIAEKRNFLGFGNIEFSSAASDDAEIVFHAVPNVEAVRDLVKKLQT